MTDTPEVKKYVPVYRALFGDVRVAPVVSETELTMTLVFEKAQFPGEYYYLDFFKSDGKCTDKKIGYRLLLSKAAIDALKVGEED